MKELIIFGRPLLHPAHKALAIGVFLLVLYFWSTFTWIGLVTVDRTVQRYSDQLSRLVYGEPLPTEVLLSPTDLSVLQVSTNPDLQVLVIFPNGSQVGQLNEDVLLREVPQVSVDRIITRKEAIGSPEVIDIPRWILEAKQPANGTYKMQVSSAKGGRYVLNIVAHDKAHYYSKRFDVPIELAPGQSATIQMNYHKEAVRRSTIVEQRGWLRLL